MRKVVFSTIILFLVLLLGCPMPVDLSVAGAEADISVTVEPNILLPWTGSGAPMRVTSIEGFPRMSNVSVKWTLIDSNGQEVANPGPTRNSANFTPVVTSNFGTFTYRVQVGDGFVSETREGQVNIGDGPVLAVSGPGTEIGGESVDFSVTAIFFETQPTVFNWTITGPNSYSITGTGSTYTWNSPEVPGTYTVVVTTTQNGETVQTSRTIVLSTRPNWFTRFNEGGWEEAVAAFRNKTVDGRAIGYFFAEGVVEIDGKNAMAINPTGGFRFTELRNRSAERMVVTLARSADFVGEVSLRHANDPDGNAVTNTTRIFTAADLSTSFQTFEITFPSGLNAHNIDFSFFPASAGKLYIESISFFDVD